MYSLKKDREFFPELSTLGEIPVPESNLMQEQDKLSRYSFATH